MPVRTVKRSPRKAGLASLVPALALAWAATANAQNAPDPVEREPGLRETIEPRDPEQTPQTSPPIDSNLPIEIDGPPARTRTEPNFGKPRPLPDPRLVYSGRRKQPRRALPKTEPYQSAPAIVRRTFVPSTAPPPPPTYAQPPQIPRRPRPKLEENPYAPLGVGFGSLRLTPFVETSVGSDTNANRSPTAPKSSSFERLDAGFKAQSNWSVHDFKADVAGSYTKFNNVDGQDRPEGSAKFNLRLDATSDTKIDFELRGALTTQRPGSPELNAVVVARPAIFTYGATAGLTRAFGRLEATVATLIDRTAYEDGKLSSGTIIPLSINDYTAYGLRGRLAYELTPGVKPFIEVTADTRVHDTPVDGSGFMRNSNGYLARAGSSFEITRTLAGEVSAGFVNRKYEDTRLRDLRGPFVDAALIWTASPLTTVTLRATTVANETTLANSSGYITRRGAIEINHALLRNLTLGGIAQWQRDQYQGIALTQDILSGAVRAEYALTRSVVVKGSFTHERLKSSVAGNDYTANVYMLGLRLQR